MAENQKQVQYDIEGSDVITAALLTLLNTYPALQSGDKITFATLADNKGKALFPSTGAIIEADFKDILGNHHQRCIYPFTVVYRAGALTEQRRIAVKGWLDDLGRWLEQQAILVNGTEYALSEYPALGAGRTMTEIKRTTPGYLSNIYDNKTEDWAISISARYRNDFD